MWTFIIITAICVIVALRLATEDYFDWSLGDVVIAIFSMAIGAIVGIAISFGVTALIPGEYETKTETWNLEALQDNGGGVSGSFFLGSGTIDSKMMYVFYYEVGENQYKMGQVEYDDATVKYVADSVTPTVIQYRKEPTDAFINNFTVNYSSPWYDINIPKGTIKSGYVLDAQ